MKRNSFKMIIATLTLATFMSGCYGSFGATRLLYNWNGSLGGDGMGGRFVRTLVMWVFTVIPAYAIFMFGDFFILNLIEFFTGKPLIGAHIEKSEDGVLLVNSDEGNFKLTPIAEDRFMVEKDGLMIGEGTVGENGAVTLINFASAERTVMFADVVAN